MIVCEAPACPTCGQMMLRLVGRSGIECFQCDLTSAERIESYDAAWKRQRTQEALEREMLTNPFDSQPA